MSIETKLIQAAKHFFLAALALLILIVPQVIAAGSGKGVSDNRSEPALTRVDAQYVCMINNRLYDKEQIPVEVAGKTYYGCCQGCKNTLRQNSKSRTAVDPVSGKAVDKASSVIGAKADGVVYYFESEANFQRFESATAQ